MPLVKANHLFILVIHSIRMPLVEANQSFVPVIPSDAISQS
jgi:hypothetical protein